ncbi:guanine nucleotide-binding protein subunit alpha [Chytriomyces hyalinus]|nr:guanine nucleotide-binding protein subunit alpha [Chytriomyces hyalinus]
MEPDAYAEWKEAKQVSDKIDAELRREAQLKQQAPKGPKLVLLGSGDSGKSTVLKQLKILHGQGFTDDDRLEFRFKVRANVLDAARMLVSFLESNGIEFEHSENKLHAQAVQQFVLECDLPDSIVNSIRLLWNDAGIQEAAKRANELPEYLYTSEYFLNNIDRCASSEYIPTDDDILRVRNRTVEITETKFTIENKVYTFFDVGGQRSLRHFWAPYFSDDLSAIIFVAALSSYDQFLLEDPEVNRMTDAISLFGSVCNNKLIQKSAIILFLNKVDLFKSKLESGTSPVEKYFPEYTPRDFKETGAWFKNKFHEQKRNKNRQIFTHFTTGTDTRNMQAIIAAVKDIVMKNALTSLGMM